MGHTYLLLEGLHTQVSMSTVSHTSMTDPQQKTPWTPRRGSLRGRQYTLYHVVPRSAAGKSQRCPRLHGEEATGSWLRSLLGPALCAAHCNVSFTVINCNREYNHLSESVSPSRQSLDLQIVLGICSPASSLRQTVSLHVDPECPTPHAILTPLCPVSRASTTS